MKQKIEIKIKKRRKKIVSISSDSAEQTVRLTLEGMEIVAKISGVAAKNIAVALYTISQDRQKGQKERLD